jgi:hypothetical protein
MFAAQLMLKQIGDESGDLFLPPGTGGAILAEHVNWIGVKKLTGTV